MAGNREYNIETSLTLDYRKSAWGYDRMVLDSISNHLPSDSKGKNTSVGLVQNRCYKTLENADHSKDIDIVVLADDGAGYDAGLLSVLFTTKEDERMSVGQFGEGLKLVAAAALRNNVGLEYRSKNWAARPYVKEEDIGGVHVKRLCFRVRENGDMLNGSRTVFTNMPKEFAKEIFSIPENVLHFNSKYRVLYNEKDCKQPKTELRYSRDTEEKTYDSRIIDIKQDKKCLFVKGVRVADRDTIFSYDLGLEEISPDRQNFDSSAFRMKIADLLINCTNEDVIGQILRVANKKPDGQYDEFYAIYSWAPNEKREKRTKSKAEKEHKKNSAATHSNAPHASHWASAFRKMFGENAIIASENNDFNKEAVCMGYLPVALNSYIAGYLEEEGIMRADDVYSDKEFQFIGLEELTKQEHAVLSLKDEIDQMVLGKPMPLELRVFSKQVTKSGREVESSSGVCAMEPHEKYIGIKRAVLKHHIDFIETYVHELGHYVTGKGDYDREFVNFFTKAIAMILAAKIEAGGRCRMVEE